MRWRDLLIAATMAMAMSGPALAAPQILGVMASHGAMPLACDERQCSALVGSFCLQRERPMPVYGTPYAPTPLAQLALSATDARGRTVALPASLLRFSALNSYSAVHVSLPRAAVDAAGAIAVRLEVGPGVSLVPLPVAGDANPQDADEIRFATGALRIAAGRWLDGHAVEADAARVIASLVNAMPDRRTIRDDNSGLWERTIGTQPPAGMDPAALDRARAAYDRCVSQPDTRRCLLSRHRELIQPNNGRFWDEIGGS